MIEFKTIGGTGNSKKIPKRINPQRKRASKSVKKFLSNY
jgi:hypothetical protein